MLNRQLDESGFPPLLTFALVFIGFYGISILLFSKTEFAAYYYGVLALSLIFKLNEKSRNDFLKTIFPFKSYLKVRISENLLLAFPFLVFLLYKQSFIVAFSLCITSILLVIFNVNSNFSFTLPTPFGKKPFEFPVGFRKTFYLFPFSYFLTYQSVHVGNFNLGMASMLLTAFIVLSYYAKPEGEFYVWSFNFSAKHFLGKKIRTALLFYTLLSLPLLISLICFFPNNTLILLACLLLGYIYIVTIILAKYSAFPSEMNVAEGVLIALSLMLPPILLITIPLFYSKAITQLKPLLEHD